MKFKSFQIHEIGKKKNPKKKISPSFLKLNETGLRLSLSHHISKAQITQARLHLHQDAFTVGLSTET